ncbi:hypothetical protein BDZ45DRAFT_549648, partial [Acephala macrosclerotiorum]
IPFLDDVRVKRLYTNYDNELAFPEIRRFVFEHIQNLNRTLDQIERNGIIIVDFVCSFEKRFFESVKIIKILKWTKCDNIFEVKAFIGICIYYKIWIQYFDIIIESLYRLTKKNEFFEWRKE